MYVMPTDLGNLFGKERLELSDEAILISTIKNTFFIEDYEK